MPGKSNLFGCEFISNAVKVLDSIQGNLLKRATQFRDNHSVEIKNLADFKAFFTPKNPDAPEIHGGFAYCYAADDAVIDDMIKEFKVTARCIPLDQPESHGVCIFTGKKVNKKIIFAKAY